MKRLALLFSLLSVTLLSQVGTPFATLPAIAPVAGVSGVQLAYDTANKVVWIQSLPAGSTLPPSNILSVNPHVLDNGGNFSIVITVSGGTPMYVLLATQTNSAAADTLVFRLSNGNAAQDKFCSNANPLPTGATQCSAIPF